MIPQFNQGFVTEPGCGAGGDAIVHKEDGAVSNVPGFQEPRP